MRSRKRVLIAGLPGSGKTTFLATLWFVLHSPRQGQSGLRLRDLSADRAYLNSIKEHWLRCEEVERTRQADRPQAITIPLVDTTGAELDLVVPDLSGELFRGLWEDRGWPQELASILTECEGTLYFLHPNHRLHSPTLEDAEAQARLAAGQAQVLGLDSESNETPTPRDFDLEGVDDAVQTVDILQSLAEVGSAVPSPPLAIVISAWDLLERTPFPSPEAFVQSAAPLLHQYLAARSDFCPIRYWGLSAQGGDYANDSERLAALDEPHDRIRVVSTDASLKPDIRAPLEWILTQGR